jgi:endonuclease/exonuclease/phosphatase family metal-dependent hydrolase
MSRRKIRTLVTALLSCWLAAITSLAAADDRPTPLRVMSFNVRYGSAKDGDNAWPQRRDLLVKTIQNFDPDLLGTQETLKFQRDFIAERMSGLTPFGVGRDDGTDNGEMTALFFRNSRFEKLDGGHFWLSLTPEVPGSKSWDTSLTRMASWVKLRDKQAGEPSVLWFLNTHFDHRGPQAREESAKLIRDWVAQRPESDRVVVTGDFNAAEGSPPYAALFGPAPLRQDRPVLLDSYRLLHPERTEEEGTYNGFRADSRRGGRIDWIAVSPGFKVTEAAIVRTAVDGRTPSDHFPVTAILAPQ